MAHHTEDDGFHEIQLNGKQLVFLFMAATVVSVVIFLCGVLVGRGVRAERASAAESAAAASPATDVVPDAAPVPAAATPAEADPTKASPPPDVNDLSYFDRLEKKNAPVDKLAKSSQVPAAPAAPAAAPRSTAPAPKPAAAATTGPAPAPAAGSGYAVQVAALNVRSEADAIAHRLVNKGYAAYVVAPPAGAPAVYRVRVGQFKTRSEAEAVAAKLKKEEQFSPWITR
ncbi:MAG: SPOR domain-containing protein [Betaproteobacteria bacterium]